MSRGAGRRPVLAVGGHVVFEGRTWQVAGLQGQQVRLVDEQGAVATLLANHLFAADDFTLVGAAAATAVPQWGLFATVPLREQERALAWQRHIREVETGHPAAAGGGRAPRPEYDPATRTLAQREQAKAEELTATGFGTVAPSTVQRMRLSYRAKGLWGLVDHRTTRTHSRTGRTDERVVAAVLEAMARQRGRSKGTVKGLRQLTAQILDQTHGPGTLKVPPPATFYRLVNALADPNERPGSPARTASSPARPYSPTRVQRPGEQVMLDTTRLDVLAVFDNGTTGRPELTIALDVASRSILAAVLRPAGTKAVDAALLLAEMATPHTMRPGWPDILALSRAPAPYELLLDADARLRDAAARPVIVPETVVVDRGRVFVSEAFLAACETLGISVQPAPPRQPTAKGPVERTFGSINSLLCQHIAGHAGSDPTRRGPRAETEALWTVAQLQDLLDQWITTEWQNRPHEGLRHPTMPATALSPNEMWGALLGVCGHVPLPLTAADYIELLPVRWKPITDRGIRIDHRTYDHHTLNPHRGQPSGITAHKGRWEVHHNPHDHRQVWVRLPDGQFTAVPWIHATHVHQPFGDDLWQHLLTTVERRGTRDQHEADLAQALDELLHRVRTGGATAREQHLATRHAPAALPGHLPAQPTAPGDAGGRRPRPGVAGGPDPDPDPDQGGVPAQDPPAGAQPGTPALQAPAPVPGARRGDGAGPGMEPTSRTWAPGGQDADSLDDLSANEDDEELEGPDTWPPSDGFGLYDARKEAELW